MASRAERVFVGLGSNVEPRLARMVQARRALAALPGARSARASALYETAPVGPKQRNFLNAVIELRWALPPEALLAALKRLEARLGRKKRRRWGPREIDLDILLFGSVRRRGKKLTLPHPRWTERRFVLAPLAALAPGLKDPASGLSVGALFRRLTAPGQWVKLYRRTWSSRTGSSRLDHAKARPRRTHLNRRRDVPRLPARAGRRVPSRLKG